MMRHYPDLGRASDWLSCEGNLIQPIRSTTQIWVVTHHQYGISGCFLRLFITRTLFFLGAMAKRRAEIEEEQELEEERMRNARLSVANEGESVSKGRVDSVEGDADGDVEMAEESNGEVGEKRRKKSESKDTENGVKEERGVREQRERERIENMEEEEGEID